MWYPTMCGRALLTGGVLLALAMAVPGRAAAGNEEATAGGSAGLEEIIVTAQRREETLQHAALAVSAVSGAELASAGVTQPADLTAVVPALQVTANAGPYAQFYLRGVGNFASNSLSESAIAFNVDGVFLGRPTSTSGFFFDLDRVEVVKGPQGTLYGRNATGGAVNVITKRPELDRFGGAVSGEYGNYSAYRVEGALNLPLGAGTAARIAAVHVQHDGYMNDGTDDQDDSSVRLSLRTVRLDNLELNLVVDYSGQQGRGTGTTIVGNALQPLGLGPNFAIKDRIGLLSPEGAAFFAAQPNFLSGNHFVPLPDDARMQNNQWGATATLDWTLPAGTFTVIPAYRKGHIDYASYSPGFKIRELQDNHQATVEARFASNETHRLRYLLGTYYYTQNNDTPEFLIYSQAQTSFQAIDTGTTSKAVFGRLSYAFTDTFRLTGGLRWTDEDKRFSGTLASNNRICVVFGPFGPSCPTATPFPFTGSTPVPPSFIPGPDGTIVTLATIDNSGAAARHVSYQRTTWRAGADWDVSDHNLLYASYETGFKAGGFFFSNFTGVYKPESIRALTLGSKNRFLDNRLQLNVELFQWKYTDQQISHLGRDQDGAIIFPTENVASARMRGAEFDLLFQPIRNTRLGADVQYLDALYQEFVYSTPNTNNGIDNGTGCPSLAVTGLAYTVDCSNRRPPRAPEWTINASVEQRFPLGSGASLAAEARMHYQSETLTGAEFLPAEMQSGVAMADFALTYAAPEDRYYATIFVDNAFDRTAISGTFPTPFSAFITGTLRPPRTYGLRAGARF